MILLRANNELKSAFSHLISTMKLKVEWNEIFVIINNNLILPGNVRSLFFNFDNRKMITNIIDLSINKENAKEIEENAILSNAISMTLYAFGKWGAISGLKVEKNYAQLNKLFQNILKEAKIEPSFRDDNFRFFKDGIQITYEDVISEILILAEKQKEDEQKEKEAQETGGKDEYSLGLWHDIKWISEEAYFLKESKTEADLQKSRLGNNFYMVDYKCPMCENKLYMVTYPVDKEFLVETDRGRLYIARAYTCNDCNCFYTPKPDRLLSEGDVFSLKFIDDRAAYEDYRELLGIRGDRCSNYKFNEYESERNKKKEQNNDDSLEQICEDLDSMTEEELEKLMNMVDDGFYPVMEADRYFDQINSELKDRKENKKNKSRNKGDLSAKLLKKRDKSLDKEKKSDAGSTRSSGEKPLRYNKEQDFSAKSVDELRNILSELSEEGYDYAEAKEVFDVVKSDFLDKLREKFNARMSVMGRMSLEQLKDLKNKISSEQFMDEDEKQEYIKSIDKALYEGEEKEILSKAEACKAKSYTEIGRVIEEIEARDVPHSIKQNAISGLRQLKREKGRKEVEELIGSLPDNADKKKFRLFNDKLEQYKDVDITPYKSILDEKRDIAEKNEINNIVRRANKRDRRALSKLIENLKGQGFLEKNTAPFIEKINDKIYEIDKKELEKICPDIMDLSFDEGIEVYEKIEKGVFLPELKANFLENIDKRLTKIKMDECEQLVRKLEKDIEGKISDKSKLHFYSPRKMLRGNADESEAAVINKALDTYASETNKYEFPILIAARQENGKEGFVLTPDHIFYNSLFEADVLNVFDIKSITASTKLINRGIYIKLDNGSKIKLPNPVPSKNEWCEFADVLGNFIEYLQKKPQSRSISYLAEEKHEVKCCYRCGYTYKGGNVCPKCGSKSNK